MAHPPRLASAIAHFIQTTMPRKKKDLNEPASVLQPDLDIEQFVEPDQQPESCNRNYLTASLQSVQASISQLFEKQSELAGTQTADTIFDAFESAFISRLEQRLQPFVDVVLPQIQDASIQMKERTTARTDRRLSAFQRLQQIASKVNDDCRLMLPGGEVSVVGEFVHWEPINQDKENA
jgi:hypothetical protein